MKKITRTLLTVGVMLNLLFVTPTLMLVMMLPTVMSAQSTPHIGPTVAPTCAVAPAQNETPIGASTSVLNTGNDVNGYMHVSVWDGSNPGLYYDEQYSSNYGTMSLHSSYTLDPDVSVVVDGSGKYWAVVVYYDTNLGGYYVDNYGWGGSSFYYSNTVTLEASTTYVGAINIDADNLTNLFGIIWSDQNGNMYVEEGSVSMTNPIYTGLFTIHTNGEHSPDISLYNNGSGTITMYYAYVQNGRVYIDQATSFTAPPSVTTTFVNSGLNPRTATPPPGTLDDCIVVYEDVNNQIMGYEYAGPTSYTYTYGCDDLSQYSCYLFLDGNYRPVVTWSHDYSNVTVAWTSAITYTCVGCPPLVQPIVVQGNYLGDPTYSTASFPFYIVPKVQTLCSSCAYWDIQRTISLAGRDDNFNTANIQYTWYWDDDSLNNLPQSVRYKERAWNASTSPVRLENNNEKNEITGIYPNPNNGNFLLKLNTEKGESITISIYNSIGQRIYSSDDIAPSTNFVKEINLKDCPDGIYLVRETGSESSNNWKIVLTK